MPDTYGRLASMAEKGAMTWVGGAVARVGVWADWGRGFGTRWLGVRGEEG